LETIIADYKKKTEVVFDMYMKLFFAACSNGTLHPSARSFLLDHNDNYRKEINDAAIQSIRSEGSTPEIIDKILELNDRSAGRLYHEIMKIAG
jgi:hypothetical protein